MCVCVCVYVHVCTHNAVLEYTEIELKVFGYLVEAGNVFRSITRTDRAHCTVNTYSYIEHVFLMKVLFGRAGHPYSMRSSGWM